MDQKKTPYVVPDGYFDELTSRVMNRIENDKKRPKLLVLLKPYAWLAAIFIIAVLFRIALPFVVSDESQPIHTVAQTEQSIDEEITSEEIIEYLLDDTDNYDALYAELYK